jgi:FtsP/CotA-like multicopper oxidase with cupredoxin domain
VQIDQEASNGRTPLPGSKSVPLTYLDGSPIMIAATDARGKLTGGAKVQALAVEAPHAFGPIINSTKDIAARVKFHNLLPVGHAEVLSPAVEVRDVDGNLVSITSQAVVKRNGDIFLPLDPSVVGSGFGPDGLHTYTQNRTNIHLHGGDTPWISDGGPHTWITPAGEADPSVAGGVANDPTLDPSLVPGFLRGPGALNVPDMNDPGPGAMTYYFPNGQSARMEWYHDHTVGMTRLNVYAGMASAYLLTDDVEKAMITSGALPDADHTIPLILTDKTFVPDDIALQDARWNTSAWGAPGDLWFPHVYETVQDPNQATNFNAVGRWHWGPWFWPSFPSAYNLPSGAYGDVTLTPEAWMDTPVVNGVAYPTLTVEPRTYRMRVLNASNDRTYSFNLFVADPTVTTDDGRSNTEVKMIPVGTWSNLCAAGVTKSVETSPGVWCTPDIWTTDVYGHNGGVPDFATQGPTLHQIGNEAGLLPGVATKDATPISYLLDKGRAAVLNTDYGTSGLHLGNAERADLVVDFSAYAGKTLLVYSDTGAPVPAADPRNEYFTGYGDQSATGGAEDTRPGYGPNSRTIMQIVVAPTAAAPVAAFDPVALDTAVKAGYAARNEPPLVAQAAYNAALGTSYNDTKAFGRIYTGSLKEPSFNFVPGAPAAGFNSVLMQNTGSGYLRPPLVSISVPNVPALPGDAQATAKASLKIDKVHVITAGSGYKEAPIVTITSLGTGSGVLNTATLKITGAEITAAGSGYVNGALFNFPMPSVAVSKGGRQAKGTLVVTAGAITGVNITDAGAGYKTSIAFAVPGGVGGRLTWTGSVDAVSVDYTDPTNPLTAGGGGYNDLSTAATEPANPTPGLNIKFTAPPAGGTLPTAGASGKVFDITLVNPGTGYTTPPTVAVGAPVANPVLAALAVPPVLTNATAAADTSINPAAPQGNILVKTKAIQELFDPTYGRLNATLGVEIPYTSALTQTTIPLGYVDAPTEDIANGETQIWKITHNGVDTHPVHFHLVNVQLINRVGWDNFISPPEPNELGWKETIKMSPLEDVIVAVRAKKPVTPGWGLPNSVRLLDPSQPEGAMTGFTQIDANTGLPAAMSNVMTDFGWEYVWHCHILGHEENDFMRPIAFRANEAIPAAATLNPLVLNGATMDLSWADNAVTEYKYRVERAALPGAWAPLADALANATAFTDPALPANTDLSYRVVAVGAAGETPSNVVTFVAPTLAPTGLAVTAQTAGSVTLAWTDVATNETSYLLSWTSATAAAGSATLAANSVNGTATGLVANTAYAFSVTAQNAVSAAPAGPVAGTTAPLAATGLAATSAMAGASSTVTLSWANANPNLGTLTSVVISGTVGGVAIAPIVVAGAATAAGTQTLLGLAPAQAYLLTVTVTGAGGSATSAAVTGTTAGATLVAPTGLTAQMVTQAANGLAGTFALNWNDNSAGESGYKIEICHGTAAQCTAATATSASIATANAWYTVPAANITYTPPVGATGAASATVNGITTVQQTDYFFRVSPLNGAVVGPVSNISPLINLLAAPAAPTGVSAVSNSVGTATVSWTDVANNNASYAVQSRQVAGIATITANTNAGWTTAPTAVVISAPAAGGVQATATAAVAAGRVVITITNPGSGYLTRPTVSLTGGRILGLAVTVAGTANANLGLGANVWTTAYANTTPPTTVGNVGSLTATGLTTGRAYQFAVTAVRAVGGQANSAAVATTGVAVVR